MSTKQVCDNCGKIRFTEGDTGAWHTLAWLDGAPTHFVEDLVLVYSVPDPHPQDLCSWKCVRDYASKWHIKETP